MVKNQTRGLMRVTTDLSRRDMLKLAASSALAAGTGGLTAARTGASSRRQADSRPTLLVGVAGTTETLNPFADGRNQRTLIVASVFDGLIARDFLGGDPPGTGGRLGPALATAWQRSDDLTLDFELRDGVTFHDGSPLTADDVAFTFDLFRNQHPDLYPDAKLLFSTVAAVEAIDPRTVRFTTVAPDPILEKRLTIMAGSIVPRRAFETAGPEQFGQAPIGTGPYRVVEFASDELVVLEAHDAYWDGAPPAARIEFRVIPEVAARVAALLSGEVDVITTLPPDQIAAVAGTSGFEVRSVPAANIRTVTYNTRHATMGDKRLRQGLNLAIDRQLISDALWGGAAPVPRGIQFPDWEELYNPERPFPAYDPERARQLIEESNYDGAPIALWLPADYYTLGEEVAQVVIEGWRQVGVAAELQLMDISEFYDDIEQKTLVSGSQGNQLADPEYVYVQWGQDGNVGRHLWSDPSFDELGQEARSTLDPEVRYRAYQAMLDILEEEAVGTPLYSPVESYGVRSGIAWQPYSAYLMDFRPENLAFS